MTRAQIVHLVDDTTAGGVMRVIDHITAAPAMSEFAQHSVQQVDRKKLTMGAISADIIVSHLAISWRAMPMLLSLRASNPRTPLVHIEHSYTAGFIAHNVSNKLRFSVLLKTAYRLFQRVVAVSEAQGQWLTQSRTVKNGALSVIRSCVDLSDFRAITPTRQSPKVIGAIGRLDRQKGFDTLIQAFRQADRADLELHIFGEGAQEDTLRRLAGSDPRIHFKGFAANPLDAMSYVDFVAMPSRWEAYGLVAIEALAARRQLWVNKVDGLNDHLAFGAIAAKGDSLSDWAELIKAAGASNPDQPRTGESAVAVADLENQFAQSWRTLVQSL